LSDGISELYATLLEVCDQRDELRAEIAELRETLAVVGGERDSLQLSAQQLDADEDWLDEHASLDDWEALRNEQFRIGSLREAIDLMRAGGA